MTHGHANRDTPSQARPKATDDANDHQHDGHAHGEHAQDSGRHVHAHELPANLNRAFALGIALNVAFVVIELVSGSLANSLALLADAGHNLSDVLGLLLAWAANYLSHARPSPRRTYGWKSSSILAALLNSQLLLIAIGGIVWEALHRFSQPAASAGGVIIWVAAAGVLINTFTALLFLSGGHRDLNIRGAFLHMAADAAVSLGVVAAGIAIMITGQLWIDPATSLLVAVIIFVSTWRLLRESLDMALHAVPRHIDMPGVKQFLMNLPGITEVHDLHVWAMSTTETALTAHLVKPEVGDDDALLATAANELHARFSIEHITLQVERAAAAKSCRQASEGVG